jgi:uncharacterized protein (TIGR02266 family)
MSAALRSYSDSHQGGSSESMPELNKTIFADVSIVARYREPTASDFIEEQCYDISKGGMFVRSFRPLPSGTLIKFECHVDDSPNNIQGVGRVAWHRDKDYPKAPAGMGVKFLVLRPGSHEIIDTVIRKAGPMPKLFGTARQEGSLKVVRQASKRTYDRAKTLVDITAIKVAREVNRSQEVKITRTISTTDTAANAVKGTSTELVENPAKQNSRPSTKPAAASLPKRSTATTFDENAIRMLELAASRIKERRSKPAAAPLAVQSPAATFDENAIRTLERVASRIKERRSKPAAAPLAVQSTATIFDENTIRMLDFAASRIKESWKIKRTVPNLKVAAENDSKISKRGMGLGKALFVIVGAVILGRLGYNLLGDTVKTTLSEQQSSKEKAESRAEQRQRSNKIHREQAVDNGAVSQPSLTVSVQASNKSAANSPVALGVEKAATPKTAENSAIAEPSKSLKAIEPVAEPIALMETKEEKSKLYKSRLERAAEKEVAVLDNNKYPSKQHSALSKQPPRTNSDKPPKASEKSVGIPDNPYGN